MVNQIIDDSPASHKDSSIASPRGQNKLKYSLWGVREQDRDDLYLPPPSPISDLLLDLGVPLCTAKASSDAFVRAGSQLRQKTALALTSTITSECDENASRHLYSVFLKMYQQKLKDWQMKTLQSAMARLNRQAQGVKDSHRVTLTKPRITKVR
jgi:hypothetical protein